MKTVFKTLNCPFILNIKKSEWFAVVHLRKDEYYINYTNDEFADPLDIDCEIIEGNGKELEDAINDLKKMLKDKKLLKCAVAGF